MDCKRVDQLLSARLDGEIPEVDAAAVESHLRDCARCTASLQELQEDDADLNRLFHDTRKSATRLEDRVVAAVRNERRPGAPFRLLVPLLAAAAGFLLAVAVFRPWEPPETITPTVIVREPSDPPVNRPPAEAIARIDSATGVVEVLDNGAWKAMPTGAVILPDMVIRTKDSRASVACVDGTELRLDENTQLAIRSANQVELAQGQIWAAPGKGAQKLEVDVGDSKIFGAEGCNMNAQRLPDATIYMCEQGEATVTDKLGNNLELGEQQTVRVKDGKVGKPQSIKGLQNWVLPLLTLKGEDDPEFHRRIQYLLARIGEAKLDFLIEEDIKALGTSCCRPLKAYIQESAGSVSLRHKRRQAAEWLADVSTADHIDDLLDVLGDADAEVRYHMARGLLRIMGPKALKRKPKFWRDAKIEERDAALKNLRGWWEGNPSPWTKKK